MSNQDYYQTLSLTRTASKKDIKRAYHLLAKKYHPDKNPGDPQAEPRFRLITQAYEILKDDKKRAHYDALTSSATDHAAPGESYSRPPQAGEATGAAASAAPIREPILDTAFFNDEEMLRHTIAAVLFVLALMLVLGHTLFTLPVLLFLPFLASVMYHFRDDIGYFICIMAPRHVAMVWVLVLMAACEMTYSQTHAALLSARPVLADSPGGMILAPVHALFYLYYALSHTGWGALIKAGFGLWFISLFVKGAKYSGWGFFALLFLLTLIARYDTKAMSDFVVYYHNLFSLEPTPV